ncbi:MAG: orotate phosphoribosyltransferase [Gemmatimonadaceae bacterium]|nr:orotate phosphoribosyltransferase [Gemmatimonadaceae bacterium]
MPTSLQFLLDDYPRTLFPLNSTAVLLSQNETGFSDYLYQRVLSSSEMEHSFLPQTRVYASKSGLHLRRTVKLDPVAEYFIYDVIYRNREQFRRDHVSARRSFGYRFEGGSPLLASPSYGEFRSAVVEARGVYKYSLRCDVATYFNALYHHDLVAWFSQIGAPKKDYEDLGKFLREANTGRSVDCLPQGLYPCKMVGAEFLKFIDNSVRLRSALVLRFMDDIYVFDDDSSVVDSDFLQIQRLLGEKALSLNASKTVYGETGDLDVAAEVDDLKVGLLRLRREEIAASGTDEDARNEDPPAVLTEEQMVYLLNLLKDPEVQEADAELVLVLLKDHGEDVLEHMYDFLERYPSLSRKVYGFSKHVSDNEELAGVLLRFVKSGKNATEDQLFWIAKIAEENLTATVKYKDLLIALYEHPAATVVSKAKVLEIPEQRFGMPQIREEQLKLGRSDWLAWAAAVGTRKEPAISRNHLLGYFGKASIMNRLVADTIKMR